MILFLDTEFTDFQQPALISIGLVSECGHHEFYAERNDFDLAGCSDFVQSTVLPKLGQGSSSVDRSDLAIALRAWLENVHTRGVLFLDPYGMSTEWSLLEQISATKAIDLWYLFPLSAFFRQAAIDFRQIDEAKAAALTKMVGTADWHSALYSRSPQAGLFDDEPTLQRHADIDAILGFVTQRLKTLFPYVEKPLVLRKDKDRGAPLFALYFAVSNPDPKAIGLARKVANHMLGKIQRKI